MAGAEERTVITCEPAGPKDPSARQTRIYVCVVGDAGRCLHRLKRFHRRPRRHYACVGFAACYHAGYCCQFLVTTCC